MKKAAPKPVDASLSSDPHDGSQPSSSEKHGDHSTPNGSQPSPYPARSSDPQDDSQQSPSEQHGGRSTPNTKDTGSHPNPDAARSPDSHDGSQPSFPETHGDNQAKLFRLQCVANSKYITIGDTATDGDEPTFEDFQKDSLNQMWVRRVGH